MADDGGPAFPVDSAGLRPCAGMSLRDWFAGMAMEGILARNLGRPLSDSVAIAFAYADAMIAERQKGDANGS